jgi:hypothetical protein
MARRPPFTDKGIAELKAGDPNGRQVWATVGLTELYDLDEARGKAREVIKRVKAGQAPFPTPAKAETFKAVAENWIARHVVAKGLRSQPEIERRNGHFLYDQRSTEMENPDVFAAIKLAHEEREIPRPSGA